MTSDIVTRSVSLTSNISARYASDVTVIELKEELRKLGPIQVVKIS